MAPAAVFAVAWTDAKNEHLDISHHAHFSSVRRVGQAWLGSALPRYSLRKPGGSCRVETLTITRRSPRTGHISRDHGSRWRHCRQDARRGREKAFRANCFVPFPTLMQDFFKSGVDKRAPVLLIGSSSERDSASRPHRASLFSKPQLLVGTSRMGLCCLESQSEGIGRSYCPRVAFFDN